MLEAKKYYPMLDAALGPNGTKHLQYEPWGKLRIYDDTGKAQMHITLQDPEDEFSCVIYYIVEDCIRRLVSGQRLSNEFIDALFKNYIGKSNDYGRHIGAYVGAPWFTDVMKDQVIMASKMITAECTAIVRQKVLRKIMAGVA